MIHNINRYEKFKFETSAQKQAKQLEYNTLNDGMWEASERFSSWKQT